MFQIKGLFGLFGQGKPSQNQNGQATNQGPNVSSKSKSFWNLIQSWGAKSAKSNPEKIAELSHQKQSGFQQMEKSAIKGQIKSNSEKPSKQSMEKEVEPQAKNEEESPHSMPNLGFQTNKDIEKSGHFPKKKSISTLDFKKSTGQHPDRKPSATTPQTQETQRLKQIDLKSDKVLPRSGKSGSMPVNQNEINALNLGEIKKQRVDPKSVITDQFAIKRMMKESASVHKGQIREPQVAPSSKVPIQIQNEGSKATPTQVNAKEGSSKSVSISKMKMDDRVQFKEIKTQWSPETQSKVSKEVKPFQFHQVDLDPKRKTSKFAKPEMDRVKGKEALRHVPVGKTKEPIPKLPVMADSLPKENKAVIGVPNPNLVKTEAALEQLHATEHFPDELIGVSPPDAPKQAAETKTILGTRQLPFTQQFEQAMMEAVRVTPKSITIRLEPDQLGEMTVKVAVNNDRIQAQIHCENEQVASLIQDSKSDLEQSLKDRGFQQFHCDVKQDQKRRFRQQMQTGTTKFNPKETPSTKASANPVPMPNLGAGNPVDLVI